MTPYRKIPKILKIFLILFPLILNYINTAFLQNEKMINYLNEISAKNLMLKYQPIVYFSKEENSFPASIEWFGIDWSEVGVNNKETRLTSYYKGPTSLRQDAPVYTSILQESDGSVRMSYVFLFGYNNCGPNLRINAKVLSYIESDKFYSVCPAGIHWTDIEHIQVHLNKDLSNVKYLKYAYHEWGIEDHEQIHPSEVEWRDTHPIVYSALGSHASYNKPGRQKYHEVIKKTSLFGNISASLYDYPPESVYEGMSWLSSNPRLLKLNGKPTRDISEDEEQFAFKYLGRLGKNMESNTLKIIENIASGGKILKDVIKEAKNIFESAAPLSLYHRKWW